MHSVPGHSNTIAIYQNDWKIRPKHAPQPGGVNVDPRETASERNADPSAFASLTPERRADECSPWPLVTPSKDQTDHQQPQYTARETAEERSGACGASASLRMYVGDESIRRHKRAEQEHPSSSDGKKPTIASSPRLLRCKRASHGERRIGREIGRKP